MRRYKYIYGPVNSWRLGRSLGIDVLSQKAKVCTFNCIYCQVGSTRASSLKRRVYVPTKEVVDELLSLPRGGLDYITFSGSGEPTLANNLGSLIKAVKGIRNERIAVFTNSTLLGRKDVQRELALADLVEAKLDASEERLLKTINNPVKRLSFKRLVNGIKKFRSGYKGVFVLQIMLVKDNLAYAEDIAGIARSIKPDMVHINTPLRRSPVKPLSKKDIELAKTYFKGIKVLSVYNSKVRKNVRPISYTEIRKRRGAN